MTAAPATVIRPPVSALTTVVPGLSGALWPVTFVVLQVVTNIYYQFAGLNRMLGARWLARPGQRSGRLPRG